MDMINASFPLIELHRHLDGSIRLETILDLGQKHNLALPAQDVEGLRPFVQVMEPKPGVMAFIEKFDWMTRILVDYDACRRVAFENVEDACAEGIDYIELRFSPCFMAQANGLDPVGVVEAVADGVEAGVQSCGVHANLIGIISRTYGVEAGWKELDALLRFKERIAGLDLAGDEINFPAEWFKGHFKRGRDAGWEITVHAGEACGPESIWQAIRDLGATRIGHGVHAVEDPALLDYIGEHEIGIESCLTSNVQTSTVADYAAHPLKFFLERGLLATINTDDPGISNIDLPYEYHTAAPAAGLTPELAHLAQQNALSLAFLPGNARRTLLERKISAS